MGWIYNRDGTEGAWAAIGLSPAREEATVKGSRQASEQREKRTGGRAREEAHEEAREEEGGMRTNSATRRNAFSYIIP